MKKCKCKNGSKGRLYKLLLNKSDKYRLNQDEFVTRTTSSTEFGVFISKRCIVRAYVKPLSVALICLMAAVFVLGIKPPTSFIWLQFLIVPVLLLIGGVLGMIAIVIFNAAILTNYFLTDTLILHVREEHSDFNNYLNSDVVNLVEKRGDSDLSNLKIKISVLLSSVAFWIVAPAIGTWVNTLLY